MSDNSDGTDPRERPARGGGGLALGTLLGPYRIDGDLGAGGMGVVYRATDTRLNRPVAIKCLNAEFPDATARARFTREAQLASALNHPHILTIYDVGEHEGRAYLVTELVDGGTLEDWLRRHDYRDWRGAVELLEGVADGLAEAHAASILHRDIKPGNVLLSRSGHAKLADFGLARRTEGASGPGTTRYTAPALTVGTVAYMSPEQASGQALDTRSDIFSFGALLYEILTGRLPFPGQTDLEMMRSIMDAPPTPLPDSIPEALRATVEKMLEKNPAERYQTMRDVAVDLRRVLRKTPSAPIAATALASVAPASARPGSRGRWRWALGGSAVIAAVAIAVVWALLPQRPAGIPRIAVLPFVDLNHETNNQLLVDGLHEEILTSLTDRAGERLQVIPRTTMALYRDSKKPLAEVATELHATHVLESTVRRDGEEVRLTLRLIDVRSERPVWDQAYTRSTQMSALTLQAEVARDVAGQLSAKVSGDVRAASKLSADPVAAEAFVRVLLDPPIGAHREKKWRDVEAELTRALQRDPAFMRARLARSALRSGFFANGYDVSEHQLELAREDLREAERLAPRDPLVLAAKTRLAILEEQPDASKFLGEAEAAGLGRAELMELRAEVTDDLAGQVAPTAELFELDPGNPGLVVALWGQFAALRKPVDVLRVLDAGKAIQPTSGLWQPLRAHAIFSFTGNVAGLAPFSTREQVLNVPTDSEFDPDDGFRIVFERMIVRGEYAEARELADAFGRESIRVVLINYFPQPGIGRQTVADFRGWADLLLADRDSAREDGRKVLAFVENTPRTRWNGWFLSALRADGLLFSGQTDEAVATARSMLADARSGNRSRRIISAMEAARVLAWAGRGDEAVALLRDLATDVPGLPPAEVARQPYFTVPLRENAMFAELKARLEAEMAANERAMANVGSSSN